MVASRNDDHGNNQLIRTHAMVDTLLCHAEIYQLPLELIIVDWNPPADRPSLRNMISLGKCTDDCAVRVINVPPEIHQRFHYSHSLSFFQMIAKNVGLRRARGEFVLATTIDKSPHD